LGSKLNQRKGESVILRKYLIIQNKSPQNELDCCIAKALKDQNPSWVITSQQWLKKRVQTDEEKSKASFLQKNVLF